MNKNNKMYGLSIDERLQYVLAERANKTRKKRSPQEINDEKQRRIASKAKKVAELKAAEERAQEREERKERYSKQAKRRQGPKLSPKYRSYINRANKKQISFNLTEEEFEIITSKTCSYCGGKGGGVDRIDSSAGYTKENVLPCCFACNIMKYKHSTDFFIARVRQIYKHLQLDKRPVSIFE